MSRFIQVLEQRKLLTATITSLTNDQAAITTAGAAVNVDMATLQNTVKLDNKAIAASLKGGPTAAVAAAKKFTTDETKLLGKIKADTTALLKSVSTSGKFVNDGKGIIGNPASAPLAAKVQADVKQLATIARTPNTKLVADSSDAGVDADLTALTAADSSLATADGAASAHLDSLIANLKADAAGLTSNVDALNVDLATLLPGPTTTPSLVGDYKGTIKTKDVAFGVGSRTFDLELDIVTQTIDTLTGTITIDNNSASGSITVVEISNGKVTFKVDNTSFKVSLAGLINVKTSAKGLPPGSNIIGSGSASVNGNTFTGSFSVTKVS